MSINEISHRTISCFGEDATKSHTIYNEISFQERCKEISFWKKTQKEDFWCKLYLRRLWDFFFGRFEPTITLSGINIFYIYIAMFHLIKLNSAARFHQSLCLPNPVGIVWWSVALIDSESVLSGKSIGDQLDWIEGSFEGSGGVSGGATPPGKRI